jgi:hypothetical protein
MKGMEVKRIVSIVSCPKLSLISYLHQAQQHYWFLHLQQGKLLRNGEIQIWVLKTNKILTSGVSGGLRQAIVGSLWEALVVG